MGSIVSLGLGGLEKEVKRGAKSFGDGKAVYGRNIEKKVWEAAYSDWEILGGSEERAMEIFDLLGTLGHEKLQTESVRQENWDRALWNVRGLQSGEDQGYPAKFPLSLCCGLMVGTSTELLSRCSLSCRTGGYRPPECFLLSLVWQPN